MDSTVERIKLSPEQADQLELLFHAVGCFYTQWALFGIVEGHHTWPELKAAFVASVMEAKELVRQRKSELFIFPTLEERKLK